MFDFSYSSTLGSSRLTLKEMLRRTAEASSPQLCDTEAELSHLVSTVGALRRCCDLVENILPLLTGSCSLSQSTVGNILGESADEVDRLKFIAEDGNSVSKYAKFVLGHFDTVAHSFAFCLDEVTDHVEQMCRMVESLSDVCEELSEWQDDLVDNVHGLLEALPSFSREPSVTLSEYCLAEA